MGVQGTDLEVLDGLDAQLERGVLVADEERLRVLLEGGHGPHVVDALLHGLGQRQRLVRARDEDHHLLGVHHGAHAHGERLPRHLADVVAEEALVGLQRVVGQRLDARARHQRGAGLVERYVPVGADACRTNRQLPNTILANLAFPWL